MASIKVVTDSACDLAPATADEHGVRVVPLTIRFGSEEFVDGEELSVKEFWDRVVTDSAMPATAAPAPGAFGRAYLDAADEGHDGVLCVTLSSGLSATYQAACAGADAVKGRVPVRVVDSSSATLGLGLLVLAAAELAADGVALDDAAARIEEMRHRTHVYGVLASLDHLKRGGRIGGAAHLVGSLLAIKPVIEIRDGVVEVESKQRTRTRSLQYLADKARQAGPLERLGVANGAAPDIDGVLDLVRQADPAKPLVVSDLGPVVGSHAGPGAVGVCFITAPRP